MSNLLSYMYSVLNVLLLSIVIWILFLLAKAKSLYNFDIFFVQVDGIFPLPVMWVVEKITKNLMIELKLTEKYTNKGGQKINEIVKSYGFSFVSFFLTEYVFVRLVTNLLCMLVGTIKKNFCTKFVNKKMKKTFCFKREGTCEKTYHFLKCNTFNIFIFP